MKKFHVLSLLILCAIFIVEAPVFAATVGNPLDLDIPSQSAILRQQAIGEAMDEHEEVVKIKAALDLEFVFDKDLNASWEMSNPEMEGQWSMFKLGTTIFNRVEPYIKIGTSELEVKWKQGTSQIEVVADSGLAWGAGVKGVIWDFEDFWDVRLTGDIQYRTTEPDVSEVSLGGNPVVDTGADFKVDEWQAAFVLSKKFELPLKWQNVYIVPYTGLTISDSNVDVKFTNPDNPGTDYTLFDASNESVMGFVLGCDIMPSLRESFIYSIELRFVNELALTLGGAMKF
ncbi:MAG: hypothetical protein HQ566_02100 [Candidatus Omnitrophica bacterium]|nr:hypothetical protein [Candidatus Omnitrophota bacterium]